MKSNKVGFASVDEYIATFPDETQRLLEEVRAIIRTAAPDAREKISYQIAAFELNGKNLIHFAGWENHISLYPIPSGSDAFDQEIAPYADGKGTLKFPLDKPLPSKLIERVVRLHVAENERKAKQSNK
ncbi:MAG: iron chaperone [Chloroflexota bacterium]